MKKKARYDVRNEIREVNKQIHGNYAYEDRMVIQTNALGQLAAQFHKWVVPAIKARYRREYFDENVGWLEGRYLSMISFMGYAVTHLGEINKWATNYKIKESSEESGEEGAAMKMLNVYRTLGEIGMMLTTLIVAQILASKWDDDDEEYSGTINRLENALIYQADRSFKEMVQFIPILPAGIRQIYQMFKSPIPSTRTLGELGEAASMTIRSAYFWWYYDEDEFWSDSDFVYQQKPRKGKSKIGKEWADAVPILYGLKRWEDFDRMKSFFIK